jgi:hypothetical protein
MGDDIGVVASPGSSAPNPILVNYHHHGGRFTVVKNELLTGEIPVSVSYKLILVKLRTKML